MLLTIEEHLRDEGVALFCLHARKPQLLNDLTKSATILLKVQKCCFFVQTCYSAQLLNTSEGPGKLTCNVPRSPPPHTHTLGPESVQVNKNVYLKGRLGGDGVALMAAFKSWFQPSVALAAAVERSFITGQTRTGLTVQVCPWRER